MSKLWLSSDISNFHYLITQFHLFYTCLGYPIKDAIAVAVSCAAQFMLTDPYGEEVGIYYSV